MIKPKPKLWVAVLVISFCWVCNVHAAGQKDLESSFLQYVREFLTGVNDHEMWQKVWPEKALEYDKTKSAKPWTATYFILSDQFTYDIRATNSIISPYVGIATFPSQSWRKEGDTKEECLKSPWKPGLHFRSTWNFYYRNGKWIADEKSNHIEIGE
jgi:hypothetical protein